MVNRQPIVYDPGIRVRSAPNNRDQKSFGMRYEGNPKHKEPWQPGRKGSLCPSHIDGVVAQELLRTSVQRDNARYATVDGIAFCGREHRPDAWHGYPVGWHEVPPDLRRQWMVQGRVTKRQMKRNW